MRFLAMLCWAQLVVAVACWVMIRFLSERWWPATLLLFGPKWALVTGAALLLLLAAVSRLREPSIAATIALVIFLCPVAGFVLPTPLHSPAPRDGFRLRVLTDSVYGMYNDGPNWAAFNQYYKNPSVDLIAMQEWGGGPWGSHVFDEPVGQTFIVDELRIWSRYPAKRLGPVFISPGWSRGAAEAFQINTPAGAVTFVDMHLASPHDAFRAVFRQPKEAPRLIQANSDDRKWQIDAVAAAAKKFGGRVILAGDFNMPAESTLYRHYLSDLTDAFTQAGWGFGWTYLIRSSSIRIDHILFGSAWTCTDCEVEKSEWSPHRKVIATLVLKK